MRDKKKYDEIWQDDMPNMDDNHLWNQIEVALDKKKEKKRKMLWIFSFLSIATISFIILSQLNIQTSHSLKNELESFKTGNTKLGNSNLEFNKNGLKNILNTKQIRLQETPTLVPKKSVLVKKLTTEIVSPAKSNQYINDLSTQKFEKNDLLNNNNNVSTSMNGEKGILKISNNKKGTEQIKKTTSYYSEIQHKNDDIDITEKQTILTINPLPIYSSILSKDRETLSHQKQLFLSSYTKQEEKQHNKLSILGIAQFGYVFTNSNFNDDFSWQKRKTTKENTVYSFSYALLLAKPVYKNLFISTGINYQQTLVNFVDRDSSITKTELIPSDSAFVIPSTNPIYLSGNKTKTTVEYRNLDTYTNISHWSIPLNIGFTIHLTNHSKLILSSGVLFRFNTHITGYTNTPNNTIFRYKDINTILKKHLGISQINLSTIYMRNISSKFDLLIGMNGILPIKPDYTIVQSKLDRFEEFNYHLNMILGVKYNL